MSQSVVPERAIVKWPNFLPNAMIPPEPNYSESDGCERWLYVGRLTVEKGIAKLVERWPAGHLLGVVGDGPMLPELRRLAGDGVDILGRAPRREVLRLMRSSVGLIFPSLCFENAPQVYPEALAMGLPILAFQGNTVAEAVEEDGTGCVTSWDVDLDEVLKAQAPAFARLRGRCRDRFQEWYDEDSYLERATSLYTEVLAAGSTTTRV